MTHHIDTLSVHAGREDFRDLGVHAPPIDLSSTYPFGDLGAATESLDTLAEGAADAANPIYARLHQPTVARWEGAIASLEQASDAVAFASGMSAITAVLMAASQRGRHIIAVRPLYGGTDHLLACGMLGLETSFAEPDCIAEAIRADTSLVILETPGNPTLQMHDIRAIVQQAGDVPVAVDSTFATPILQQPLSLGATYVIHSATKFLSGHGDVVAGVVACDQGHAESLRQVRILTGGILHPWAAYLLHRSLPTLSLRVQRAQDSALRLATRLQLHPAVRQVHYPGLSGQDSMQLIGTQMSGPGAVLAFDLDHFDQAASLLKHCQLITPAVSLGATDTLIQHPAGLTHRLVEPDARARCGIGEGLVRLSVGLESVDDLWAELHSGLDQLLPMQTVNTTLPSSMDQVA